MVKQLIAEVTDCEYKQSVEKIKPKSWLKTVSAFANGIGGSILFGIEDAHHEIVGLANAQEDVEFISQLIRQRIEPFPSLEISAVEHLGKTIIALTIKPDMQTPHYYHADGRREAYVRIGDRSEIAPPEILNELILRGSNRTYDSLASGIPFSAASFTVLRAQFKQLTGTEFSHSDFASFGLTVSPDDALTNAGALLSDEPLIRHSRLFCTRWDGLHKDDVRDDAEFSGSLLILLREGEAFIKRHNLTSWEKTPTNRIDRPSYAQRAITEALVNALIHRDYLHLGSEVSIDIYDDRLVISSPGDMFENGKLPNNPSSDEVKSKRRNPVLADLFQRLGYMERRGSGLHRICHETSVQDNFKVEFMPVFKSDGGVFDVTLWNMNYVESVAPPLVAPLVAPLVTPLVEALLVSLQDGALSITEIMGKLSLSDRRNFRKNYLNPALDAGLVERTIPDKPNSSLQKYRRIHH